MNTEPDNYDSPWKDILEHVFPEFMAYYFASVYAQIDWSKGHEFKNTELRQVVRDAELGKRFADCLVRVTLKSGGERWIYIHIEVQGQREAIFPKRIFIYNYRIYDRFDCPVASLVILADDDPDWKPDHFEFEVFGCRHSLTFPVVKLTELASSLEELEHDANPFAIVTAAHLRTRQTKNDPQGRYQAKRTLVRLLYTHGWDRQRILDLFAVLDWMMRLPDGLEQKLWQDIEQIEGETRMRYVTSVERLATERGMQQGMQQGIQQGECSLLARQLTRRFGALPEWVNTRLQQSPTDLLETWGERVLDAKSLEEVFDETRH
ncbi:MAG: DUF4351 domain-containing protein [Rhodoferax sp.]|nr:DUF4351 domain-containing protein [Rhodoferax sp.]